jgi:hypothetical protein
MGKGHSQGHRGSQPSDGRNSRIWSLEGERAGVTHFVNMANLICFAVPPEK